MNLSAIFFVAAALLLSSIAGPAQAQDESATNPPAEVDVTALPENPNPPMPTPEVAAELEPDAPAITPAPPEPLPEQPAVEEAITAAPPIAAEPTAPVAAPAEKPSAEAAPVMPPITPAPATTEKIPAPAAEGPTAEKPAVEEPQAGEPPAEEPAKVKPDAPAITPVAIEPLPPVVPSVPLITPAALPVTPPAEAAETVEQPAEVEAAEMPVAAEPPVEPEVARPPPAEEPVTIPAIEPEVSTQAPTEAVAPEPPPEKAAAETKEEVFELERGALEVGKEAAPTPPSKVPLWQRLIGRAPATTAATEEAGAAAVPAAEAAAGKGLTPEELIAAQEEVRRQAKEVEALKALDLAYQAMSRNEFEAAVKLFNQALNLMPARPHTLETRQKAKQSQAECEYRLALNYYKAGKYGDAKTAIGRALDYYGLHQRAMRLSEQIKRDEERRITREAMPTPPRLAPEYLDRQKQVQAAIERGRQYYAIGQYENARREFRNVLALDEKNEEAAAHLKRLADKLYQLEGEQMKRQQAEMIAQVRDTWTPPVKREVGGPGREIGPPPPIQLGKRRLLDKLNNIKIPQLEFRQANIVDVISYLDKVSRANDKESPPGEEGVNFILQLRRPGAAEAVPSVPAEGELVPEGEAVSAAPAPAGAAAIPAVTLSLRNIVLMDAIKYITEVTGLKYRIEENVVVIMPSDMLIGELVTRTYKVQPSIAETLIGAGGGAGAGGAAVEFGAPTPTVERGDVKKFFVDAGVPFPEGTSIVYKPSLNLLIVKNTAENLENFERILKSLDVVPVQVEIEARFVEVAQQDLEELGLEWILTDNWELAQDASANAPLQLSARERIQMNQNAPSKGLRNLVLGASGVGATPGGDLAGILSVSSVLTNPEVTMILHALEQRSGANLLSAPKVTTKTGANAEIKVVRELIYPTEFTLSQSQVAGSGSGSSAVVSPSFVTPAGFEKRDTGVILNVTPTVGPDGFSIDLVMLPQVVELADWVNYGSTVIDARGNPQVMNMPQPIFHTRTITTGITIWDGQTVVMGGLITEGQVTTKDKVPVLGDIPLLGALFRSETSNSKKFNLLIFVTANLVDPAGNKINKEVIATAAGGASSAGAVAATATPSTTP